MDERQVNLQHYLSCNIKARILKSRVTKSETDRMSLMESLAYTLHLTRHGNI